MSIGMFRSFVILAIYLTGFMHQAQTQTQTNADPGGWSGTFVIVKNDGTRFYGQILFQNSREVLIETREIGQVYIPRHEIREIRQVASRELDEKGFYMPGEVFSTRYFITTNALQVQRAESYILWNLYGPDFQFGVTDNLGLGLMTSWLGYPIVGTAKYSLPIGKGWNGGAGLLLGTGSWAMPDFLLAMPFGTLTYGDRAKNFSLTAGYGGIWYNTEIFTYQNGNHNYTEDRIGEGSFLFSLAGMIKVNRKLSLVFDSFIVPRGGTYETTHYISHYNWETGTYHQTIETYTNRRYSIAVIIPGLRFQTKPETAFQFGFAGILAGGHTIPAPIPMLQWFRRL